MSANDADPPRRRRIVAAPGGPGIDDPALRSARMNRTEFMNWAENMLAERLCVRKVHREGDNNVQNFFSEDVHIGIVATVEPTVPYPSSPCIRVQIWTHEARRIRLWKSGWKPRGACPSGTKLEFRIGDYGNRHYLEFSWKNHDLQKFQLWTRRVMQCVDFFVAARDAGGI